MTTTRRLPSSLGPLASRGLALLALAGAFACTNGAGSNSESATQALDQATDVVELGRVLGSDRVGDTLRAHATAIPNGLSEFERLFSVGRACPRTDSKEIFVVEEKSTRLSGAQETSGELLPRLVIGGCNRHPQDPSSLIETFELLLAVVSDKTRPADDPLSTEPNVEAMALDTKTGLYNFYVIEKSVDPNKPGTVTRFVRRPDDVIEKWQKVAGSPATKEVSTDRKCFNCHTNGGPIMNEMTEPWTNWVSSHKTYSRPLTGASRELISEARPLAGEHQRSSLANELEQVIRASMQAWVEGVRGRPSSGLGSQVMSGAEPGGVKRLLRSVLCETEVNYASILDTVPTALFIDGSVAELGRLEPPVRPLGFDALTLLPVRSEADLRIERFLQKARVLGPDTVLAARLIDDAHAVFSKRRCDLLRPVSDKIDAGAAPDEALRATLADVASDRHGPSFLSAATRAFISSLVDPAVDPDTRDAAESTYLSELATRYAGDTANLKSYEGQQLLVDRWSDRQSSAHGMYADTKNPLPVMPK